MWRKGRAAVEVPQRLKEPFLLFTVSDQVMGVGIGSLGEVIPSNDLTNLPAHLSPEGIKIKQAPYRGRRIPVIPLAELFDYAVSSKPGSQQVLVVKAEGLTFGLLADAIEEVVEVDSQEIQPMPGMATLLNPAYFRGLFLWKGRIVILLDEKGLAKLETIVRFEGV
ncbi:MAG: chemotaxis protein CheW [Candidatus Methylomirabilales bacterium]